MARYENAIVCDGSSIVCQDTTVEIDQDATGVYSSAIHDWGGALLPPNNQGVAGGKGVHAENPWVHAVQNPNPWASEPSRQGHKIQRCWGHLQNRRRAGRMHRKPPDASPETLYAPTMTRPPPASPKRLISEDHPRLSAFYVRNILTI